MRASRLFFFTVLFVGCAISAKKSALPRVVSEKTFEAASETSGTELLRRKQRYLEILYEQSIEPYYGTPKWAESCLKETQIGKVSRGMAISTLYLDAKANPGGCPGVDGNKKVILVFAHCLEKKVVRELRFDFVPEFDVDLATLCAL